VCIESKLLELGQSHLLVEMAMYDEKKTALKAILWTNFTCIDVKTGRKQDHPASFMEFARAMYVHDINIQGGISERIQTIINPA
jgi:acyl-CoA thioester hydrolase